MDNQNNFNLATVLSIIALLVFSYFTFMGLVYWKNGELSLPLILTFALIVIVLSCVYILRKSKATRWRVRGWLGQFFFGIIIFVALLLSAFPFTNFLRVVEDSDQITEKVSEVCDAAIRLDESYENYVNDRIEKYKSELAIITKGKNANPSYYKKCMGQASGATDQDKIEGLTKSLRNKLYPETTTIKVQERHNWLEKARTASIWNPLTPTNICKVDTLVNGWLDNYKKLSSVSYIGEHANDFDYNEVKSQISQLTDCYRQFHRPTTFALIMSVLCFFIMLLPYFITNESIASRRSKGKEYE